MKYTRKLILALGCMISYGISACVIPSGEQEKKAYSALNSAVAVESLDTIEILLNKFCYSGAVYLNKNKEVNSPLFFTYNINIVQKLSSYGINIADAINNPLGIDLLSYMLIKPALLDMSFNSFVGKEINPALKNEIISTLKPFNPKISEKIFINVKTDEQKRMERKQMLKMLAKRASQRASFQKDPNWGNYAFTYAIIINDSDVLKELLDNQYGFYLKSTYLYRKNNQWYTPFHMAFANKSVVEKSTEVEDLRKINDLLISSLEQSKIKYLTFNNVTFFEFAELMKDKNPEFYEKLKSKFKFTVTAHTVASLQKTREKFIDETKFIENLKRYEHD